MRKTKALCLALLMLSVMLAAVPALAASSELSTDIASKSFTVGEWTYFSFSTKANSDAGKMINARSNFSNPAAIEALEYKEVLNNTWQPLSHDPTDLGPAGGFPMGDATMEFRVKFKTPGDYSFTAEVYEVGNSSTVLCATTTSFTVQRGSELTTDIGTKTFVVGVPTEFTFSTKANGHRGMMVVGTSSFSNPNAIEKLEYFEPADGKWHDFGLDPSDFGPASGFPMSDATSRFRVTFKKAGAYSFTASMKRVADGKVLCSTDVDFAVVAPGAVNMPKTGDNTPLLLLGAFMVASAAAFVALNRKKANV